MSTATENMIALTDACNGLYDVVNNKINEIDTAVDTAIDELDTAKANIAADEIATAASRTNVEADETAVAISKAQVDADAADIATAIADINNAIVPKLPIFNILRDGGRFIEAVNDPAATTISGGFDASRAGQIGYNGAVISDGGKFTHNNSTYGGGNAALPTTVDDLMTAMGWPNARYGTEFHIAKVTAGTGTAGAAVNGNYVMIGQNALTSVMSLTGVLSYAFWVRLTAGTATVLKKDRHWLDGVEEVGNIDLQIADGWQHIAGITTLGTYLSYGIPPIFGVDGTIVEFALPVFAPAKVQLPIHKAPAPYIA